MEDASAGPNEGRPIGIKGRHLYLVEFRIEPESESPSLVELPAEEMQAVQGTASRD